MNKPSGSPEQSPSPEPSGSGSSRWVQWSRLAGIAIGIAGILFVSRTLLSNRREVAEAAANARPLLLLAAGGLGMLGMVGMGLVWRVALRILGADLGAASSLRAYFVGQLGKYVPGGVWAIMGRGEWARSEGVPGPVAYGSVVLSIGSTYLAAILLAVGLLPWAGPVAAAADRRFLAVLGLLPLGLALAHPRAIEAILRVLRRITHRQMVVIAPSWSQSLGLVVRLLPSWLLLGATSVAISLGLGYQGSYLDIIFASTVSWIIGFLALPVPGGVGVRESVFVALTPGLPAGIAATVAVIARLVFIVVDTTAAGATTLIVNHRSFRRRGR